MMNVSLGFKKTMEYQVVEELCRHIHWQKNGFAAYTDSERLAAVCDAIVKAGGVFDSAVLSSPVSEATPDVCYAFRIPERRILVQIFVQGKRNSFASAGLDAAFWDERKIRDLAGNQIEGLEDSRPLLAHPESGWNNFAQSFRKDQPTKPGKTSDCANQQYPFEKTSIDGEFEIPVGPVHAGIIQPGHFRFLVGGEDIHKMETRMFYLHRGLERQAVGRNGLRILPLIEQVSGDESVANSVAYAQAVEEQNGMPIPPRALSLRLVLLELERIYSHLADLGGMAADVGYNASSSRFSFLRENQMRLNQGLCGNRFLRGAIGIGGVNRDMDSHRLDAVANELQSFSEMLDELESMTLSSSTFLDRVATTGRISHKAASELALVGPAARASNCSCDLRVLFPYGPYQTRKVSECRASSGDVLARFNVKSNEVKESVRLVLSEIADMPTGPFKSGTAKSRPGFAWGWTEAPRGGISVFVRTQSGKIQRMSIRTASFRNWRGLEHAVKGNIVPDFPLINKSFNLSYAGTDL